MKTKPVIATGATLGAIAIVPWFIGSFIETNRDVNVANIWLYGFVILFGIMVVTLLASALLYGLYTSWDDYFSNRRTTRAGPG